MASISAAPGLLRKIRTRERHDLTAESGHPFTDEASARAYATSFGVPEDPHLNLVSSTSTPLPIPSEAMSAHHQV